MNFCCMLYVRGVCVCLSMGLDFQLDSAVTLASHLRSQVVSMVKERIGLASAVQGFSLFEIFGALERNMLSWEKVCLFFPSTFFVCCPFLNHGLEANVW